LVVLRPNSGFPGCAISVRSCVGTKKEAEVKALSMTMSMLPSPASSTRANVLRFLLLSTTATFIG